MSMFSPESLEFPVGDFPLTQKAISEHDPVALARQARLSVGVLRTSAFVVQSITGANTADFLQNRLSNDVLALLPGTGQLNAALDRQGKIEGVFSLHCQQKPDSFFLIVESAMAKRNQEAILRYRIMEQVEIKDGLFGSDESLEVLLLQGPKSADVLQSLGLMAEGVSVEPTEFCWWDATMAVGSVRVVRRSLVGEDGYFLLVGAAHADALHNALLQVAEKLGGGVMSAETLDILRVEAGFPFFGRDYTHDTLLPETGLERLAVNYEKGCYLGQETVARIRTYGALPRLLSGLRFEAGVQPPAGNGAILLDGKEIGQLRSVVHSAALGATIALAALGRAERIPGQRLSVSIAGEAYSVTICHLPFVTSGEGRVPSSSNSARQLLADGLAAFAQNRDEEALSLLREAIRVDDKLLEAYEALGVILGRQADRGEPSTAAYQEAITLMEKVLALNPDHVLAHTNLSVFYMKLGDKDKAEAEKAAATMATFRAAMKEKGQAPLSPEAEAERILQERQTKEKSLREKVDMFRQALAYSPDDPLGNFGLASSLLELNQFEEAVEPFRKTIAANPKQSMAYVSLGKALEALLRPDEAIETYRQGEKVAAARGDLMPLQAMQARLAALSTSK